MTNKIKLNIDGMSCGHCERSVHNILSEIPGVEEITVNAKESFAEIAFDPNLITIEEIKSAINNSGIYKAN